MARARQRSCFWPWERLAPEEEMGDVSERKMLVFSFGASSVAVADEAELGSSVAAVEDSAVTSGSGTGVVSVEGMRWTLCKASLSWKSVN